MLHPRNANRPLRRDRDAPLKAALIELMGVTHFETSLIDPRLRGDARLWKVLRLLVEVVEHHAGDAPPPRGAPPRATRGELARDAIVPCVAGFFEHVFVERAASDAAGAAVGSFHLRQEHSAVSARLHHIVVAGGIGEVIDEWRVT